MTIHGSIWNDTITPFTWPKHSTNGADSINGYDGWDFISAGDGADTVNGGNGNDKLFGDAGADKLSGGNGHDELWGGTGRDILSGGSGNDWLHGGEGADRLTGGVGRDSFVFDTKFGASNIDTITDFKTGEDHIVISPWIVPGSGLTPGGLWKGQFYAAAGATEGHDANDRLIYNTTTGALYYDVDGSGSKDAVQIAVLTGAPTLHSGDFAII